VRVAAFQFEKRSQLFIRVHNETLSVAAMCIGNKDYSPLCGHACDATPTPTGFAEIIGDYFPVLHTGTVSLLIVLGHLRCSFVHF
jgi:hypothetical protein